jgi:hypothetical protein
VSCGQDVLVTDKRAATGWSVVACDQDHPRVSVLRCRLTPNDAQPGVSTDVQVGYSTSLKYVKQVNCRCNVTNSMEQGLSCYLCPCHHGVACPPVGDGGDDLQIWRVAANLLNKQARTADKGGPPSRRARG